MNLLNFQQAIAKTKDKPHVLLGNGFSRACRNDIFAYGALFDRADFGQLSPETKESFSVLDTTDFEVVMKALRNASKLVALYSNKDAALAERLRADADGLRDVLASAIAQSHPDRPSDIADHEYAACRGFLAHFKNIYTLNYDLLLYWAVMHTEIAPKLKSDDGFRTPEVGDDADYVTWEIGNSNQQNIHYLHGALHLYDAGHELKKFTWSKTGVALIEQIRSALSNDLYPLVVAEGESNKKLDKINHSNYLSRSYRSFGAIGGALFVHGHSMAENDEHLIKLIERGKVGQLFVSLHGDPNAAHNGRIRVRVDAMQNHRPSERPLETHFYDAASADVWGKRQPVSHDSPTEKLARALEGRRQK